MRANNNNSNRIKLTNKQQHKKKKKRSGGRMRTEPHHEFCSARFTERCSGAKHGEREAGDDVNVEPRAGRGQGRRRREEREREGGSVRCSITLVSAVRSERSGAERSSDSVLRGPQHYSRARTTRPDRATRSGTDPPHPAEKTETFYSLTYFFFFTPNSLFNQSRE